MGGVVKFSRNELERLLVEYSGHFHPGTHKSHIPYLQQYLSKLKATTIVIEHPYVDKDYIEDFSAYYVSCFGSTSDGYDRFCARLHFFKEEFDEDALNQRISQSFESKANHTEELGYLGFVVVRPIPQKFIGRTCLQHYEFEGLRYFPATHKYHANLYGMELEIQTLAYQEQDGVVGACATSALWVCFQQTSHLFKHRIPKSVEISNNSVVASLAQNRAIPSSGLELKQVAQAIRNMGLEPDIHEVNSVEFTCAIAYAYLKCGIPVFLVAPIYEVLKDKIDGAHMCVKLVDLHAMSLTGYLLRLNSHKEVATQTGRLNLVGAGIEKLFAHDDQVGPFARLTVDREDVFVVPPSSREQVLKYIDTQRQSALTVGKLNYVRNTCSRKYSFASSWHQNVAVPNSRVGAEALIVPVDKKIRIPFLSVLQIIWRMEEVILWVHERFMGADFPDPDKRKPVWDIFLCFSNQLKQEIASENRIDNDQRLRLLLRPWPKYVWRATCQILGDEKLELIFDATDLEFSDYFVDYISTDNSYVEELRRLIREQIVDKTSGLSPQVNQMLKSFAED